MTEPLDRAERARRFHEGAAFTEMNTILRRLRSREPTARERARLAELRQAVAELRGKA